MTMDLLNNTTTLPLQEQHKRKTCPCVYLPAPCSDNTSFIILLNLNKMIPHMSRHNHCLKDTQRGYTKKCFIQPL